MNNIRLVVSDFDRTFTDGSLYFAPDLIDAILNLKRKGVRFSIVSGRKFSFMRDIFDDMGHFLDSFVAENGCVGFFEDRKHFLCEEVDRDKLLKRLERKNVPYDAGDVVVSVHHGYGKELDESLKSMENMFHVIKNVDSLMVLPYGVSKGTGVKWLSGLYGVSATETACIGDAENDLEMREYCCMLGAVSNALPSMKEKADYVTRGMFGNGLKEFLEFINNNHG
ncbi:haloacid dehalogenase [Methanocella sp. CWC-04]|uniref:Haloacid dehalogenase n=1 Tax=Methanooceanicella nereidis TaxID=2052831 RepID=A0AAP2RCM5_9EURY|nr:HAD hydrolase family protein [Methanocella sp. CWC-04]MCD1294426.1 haloacid dehalogenase [Methanocella sp. CWC-04]